MQIWLEVWQNYNHLHSLASSRVHTYFQPLLQEVGVLPGTLHVDPVYRFEGSGGPPAANQQEPLALGHKGG